MCASGGGAHARECVLLRERGVKPAMLNYTDKNWLYTALSILRVLFLKQVRLASESILSFEIKHKILG